jgi:hypothetical protein
MAGGELAGSPAGLCATRGGGSVGTLYVEFEFGGPQDKDGADSDDDNGVGQSMREAMQISSRGSTRSTDTEGRWAVGGGRLRD